LFLNPDPGDASSSMQRGELLCENKYPTFLGDIGAERRAYVFIVKVVDWLRRLLLEKISNRFYFFRVCISVSDLLMMVFWSDKYIVIFLFNI
jgi:hypothetical protein